MELDEIKELRPTPGSLSDDSARTIQALVVNAMDGGPTAAADIAGSDRKPRRRRARTAAFAVAVLVASGSAAVAADDRSSEGGAIRIDKAADTIQQDLPDLSHEPHDEAALRAEGARQKRCLEAYGMTEVVQIFEFKGTVATQFLEYKSDKSGLSRDERSKVDLRCSARMAVLISDFEPAGS